MKKITSILLSVLMLISVISGAIPAYAAQSNDFNLRYSSRRSVQERYLQYYYNLEEYEPVDQYRISSGKFVYAILKDETLALLGYMSEDKNVVIPSEIDGRKVRIIAHCAFANNEFAESITLPETVKVIESNAFMDCTSLTTINLSEGLETIRNRAFAYAPKLKNLYIPSTVTDIGSEYLFYDSLSLANIEVAPNNMNYSSKDGVLFNKDQTKLIYYPCAKSTKTYKIPSSVKVVEADAFRDCRRISKLVIGDNLKSFSTYGIAELTGVKEFSVSKKNKYFSTKDGVLFNKDKSRLYRYTSNNKRKTYKIPKSVKSIECGAFYCAKYLKNLYIPKNVRHIYRRDKTNAPNSPFDKCYLLENVYYSGSKKDWRKIYFYAIDGDTGERTNYKRYYITSYGNSYLSQIMNNAKIHYNAK